MPGGDRTGPLGEGPMTGRGDGYCAGGSGAGYAARRGFGRGFRAWGRGFSPFGRPVDVNPGAEDELLKERAHFLQSELDWIKGRIDDIESKGSGS